VIEPDWVEREIASFTSLLENEFEAAKSYLPNKADWFEGAWAGLSRPQEAITERRNVATGVSEKVAREVGEILTTVPADLNVHKTLARIVEARRAMFESGEGFDWATAEALAFGTLLREGHPVRLSGQDSGRGTFSQRHAVWVDQKDGRKYIPLTRIGPARFEVRDSPLSEFGVMGFEYGYSLSDPQTLVLWEAQFGDFANGAQVMLDQFISAGEAKWLRASGIVLLLPHGYEGQGPEHSSARPERFLQLCAEDNMQVANCTTPANYFHILRRQMNRDFRKPLAIMTPKSLLRHKAAVSSLADFTGDSHFMRILSDPSPPRDEDVKRLVLCTGKLAYELIEARDEAGDRHVSVVRIEQLYPFPGEALLARLRRMTHLEEVVWAQEEPQNQGYWTHVEPRIERRLGEANLKPRRPIYAGRPPAASPATGLAKRHSAEQAALIADALGHSRQAPPQRKAG
jgi:2-oxoglutarate dehydrogenase E1 component